MPPGFVAGVPRRRRRRGLLVGRCGRFGCSVARAGRLRPTRPATPRCPGGRDDRGGWRRGRRRCGRPPIRTARAPSATRRCATRRSGGRASRGCRARPGGRRSATSVPLPLPLVGTGTCRAVSVGAVRSRCRCRRRAPPTCPVACGRWASRSPSTPWLPPEGL